MDWRLCRDSVDIVEALKAFSYLYMWQLRAALTLTITFDCRVHAHLLLFGSSLFRNDIAFYYLRI